METEEIKEEVQNILNKKNTVIVAEFIKTATQKMYDQQIEINQLKGNLSNLVEKVSSLENQLAVWKGQSMGHGPSVNENQVKS